MKYASLSLFLLSLFVMLQSTSCKFGNKFPKETRTLDSLQILVIKADSAVKLIDSAKITGYATIVMNDNQLIQMAHLDSMSPSSADIFRQFNKVRWDLLTVAGKRGPLLIELRKSQKQLDHLSHDITNNLVAKDSVPIYVGFESKKASELVQVSNISVAEVNQEIPKFTMLAPKADSLMTLIKEHKKI